MKKKAKKGKRTLPKIKKNVKKFLSSEKGKISKRRAVRLGMGILAAGMGLSGLTRADAACWTSPSSGTGTGTGSY